jgi:hypothetical protein
VRDEKVAKSPLRSRSVPLFAAAIKQRRRRRRSPPSLK